MAIRVSSTKKSYSYSCHPCLANMDADGLTMSDQPFTEGPLVLKKHRTVRITNCRERSLRCAAPPSAQSCCCIPGQLRHSARPAGMSSLSQTAQTTLLRS